MRGSTGCREENSRPMLNFLSRPIPPFHLVFNSPQHVKVGIVGGSDLVKISEQLGENSALLV